MEYISSKDYESGVVMDYLTCDPNARIIKIQASLDGNVATIKAVVNIRQQGEIYLNDVVELEDGDRIYAEPDDLAVLKPMAGDENVATIHEDSILLGVYHGESLVLFPTVEP